MSLWATECLIILAIIHYSPDSKDSAIIDKEEVYLCDSGGMPGYHSELLADNIHCIAQFFDGTTDVTRTWVRAVCLVYGLVLTIHA